jgi:hypothetical protein
VSASSLGGIGVVYDVQDVIHIVLVFDQAGNVFYRFIVLVVRIGSSATSPAAS